MVHNYWYLLSVNECWDNFKILFHKHSSKGHLGAHYGKKGVKGMNLVDKILEQINERWSKQRVARHLVTKLKISILINHFSTISIQD